MKPNDFAKFGAFVIIKRIKEFYDDDTSMWLYASEPRPGEYAWTTDLKNALLVTNVLTEDETLKDLKNKICEQTNTYHNVEIAKLVLMNL